ncbi:MAG: hypothetical protein AB7S41_00830 [Parvibaculaceae bacterium]
MAFSNTDYEAVEAAVLNTARGRWFLAEHARRNRGADTHTLLEAIRKLENGLDLKSRGPIPPETLAEINEIARSIAIAKVELTEVASEMAGEINSRRVLDALVRLAQAEERLEALVGAQASRIAAVNTGAQPLTPENLSYFREDEELFAPRQAEAAPKTSEPEAMAAIQASSRRKVVARSQPLQAAVNDRAERAGPRGEMPTPRPSEQAHARPRIMVVRSRPSDETRIPLAEEGEQGNALTH